MMDIDDARRQRRDQARRRLHRQRRIALAVLLAAGALLIAGAASLVGGDGGAGEESGTSPAKEQATKPAPPPELPGGGRRIFPDHRVVGFYGAPQADELGILGIGTPAQAARKLRAQARPYRKGGRKILPAFELLGVIADADPGPSGQYRTRQPAKVISRYLKAARKAKAILILDIQPGRADFMKETRALRRFLMEPDVGLALDPEWSMRADQVPGQVIGSTTAAKVNQVSKYLADIVREGNLPEKMLLVHQFTDDMVQNKRRLVKRPGVALTLNIDGFGGREIKVQKYRDFVRGNRRFFRNGFKLFYKEDTNLMTPARVLKMRPRPDIIVYE